MFQDLGFFSETAHERENRSDRYEARWHAHGSADFSAWSLQRDFKVFNGSVVTHGYPSLSPKMCIRDRVQPWELDRLTVKTIRTLNETYESPYQRKIEFPLRSEMPAEERDAAQGILLSLIHI